MPKKGVTIDIIKEKNIRIKKAADTSENHSKIDKNLKELRK